MTANWEDMAIVGQVSRPHGLRGQVVVCPVTDFPDDRFRPGSTMWAERTGDQMRALGVSDARWHGGRLLVTFVGIDTIDAAEALGRVELRVPLEALRVLPPGQYYHHDLKSCRVVTADGQLVGSVVAVEEAGTSSLVVQGEAGEVWVPLVADICVSVDVVGRCITIVPPPGLLDVNRRAGTGRRAESRRSRPGA